jgi:hypothetical protein
MIENPDPRFAGASLRRDERNAGAFAARRRCGEAIFLQPALGAVWVYVNGYGCHAFFAERVAQ